MDLDKIFRLKHGETTIPDDGTIILYTSVYDGVQLRVHIPVMKNIYVHVQKNAHAIQLPEVNNFMIHECRCIDRYNYHWCSEGGTSREQGQLNILFNSQLTVCNYCVNIL